jgi:biotin carboxyl carrier protein
MIFYEVSVGDRSYRIELERVNASSGERPDSGAIESRWKIRIDGCELLADCLQLADRSLSLIVNGESLALRLQPSADGVQVLIQGGAYQCRVRDPRSMGSRNREGQHPSGEQRLTASMPGRVVRVLARRGEAIAAGQGIVVIEAMKMQNEVRAPRDGIVKSLTVQEGAAVNAGEVLAVLE